MTAPTSTPLVSPDFAALRAALSSALSGQYRIERELGRGGMGIVVLAVDERLERHVALKVLPPVLAETPNTRERFLREARMAAQLSHPNIVPVHRADDIGGFAFFSMGFVDGENLGEHIRARGTVPPTEVVRILRETAWALAYAHARGIVHRDVKPENILLEQSTGRALVTDFGIARSDFNPALTQDGLVLGTVHYMSPEQANGDTLDGRSDLYALGCVGYFALSGRLPFEGESPQAILVAHATRIPPPLRSVAPHVPAPLAAVIDRCLCKSPSDRFSTGEELAEALGKALDTVDQNERAAGTGAVLSNDQALHVWRRAAELQAEAASRLESRMREVTQQHQRINASVDAKSIGSATSDSATPAATSDASALATGTHAALPTDAYRLRDVEAAAAEVGISQQYVALALAEMQASPTTVQRHQGPTPRLERLATRIVGTTQKTLQVSRVFRHPPAVILQALGRTLQSAPYALQLRDTLGGHPLDGGVLVFEIPKQTLGDSNYKWTWTRNGLYAKDIRVAIAKVPGDSRACEVSLQIDLRKGLLGSLAAAGAGASFTGGFGALIGLIVAKKGLALAGAALLGPMFGGGLVLGLAGLSITAPLYRWELRKSHTELESALEAIENSMRTAGIFSDPSSSFARLGS